MQTMSERIKRSDSLLHGETMKHTRLDRHSIYICNPTAILMRIILTVLIKLRSKMKKSIEYCQHEHTPTIKTTRNALMVTQERMGELMAMPQSSIARIEAGDRTETAIHRQMLRMLLIIANHGLLGELK